eukprot:6183971-Pleurochrysis_carterae.AAC.3
MRRGRRGIISERRVVAFALIKRPSRQRSINQAKHPTSTPTTPARYRHRHARDLPPHGGSSARLQHADSSWPVSMEHRSTSEPYPHGWEWLRTCATQTVRTGCGPAVVQRPDVCKHAGPIGKPAGASHGPAF